MTMNTQITFVCCVESGGLEEQTIRMIESLRRWGGRFAKAPVIAVTPRFGPPLSRQTLKAFEKLGVEYLRFHAQNKYAWKSFLNKHYAMVAVEETSTSEFIGWLDSDLLIVGEPEQLQLQEGEDFAACAPDKNMGTSGPDDPCEAYWKEACRCVGMDIEDLPWITTELEGQRIRLYWNSGVFVYRRSTGFAKEHLNTTLKFFDSRIASKSAGVYFTQHTLGMTMVKMGLSWRALPHSHNYGTGSKSYEKWYNQEKIKQAKILHYHDSMWPDFWPTFIRCMQESHPTVAEWLSSIGPLNNNAPLQWRLASKILQSLRSNQEVAYRNSCRLI